MGNRGQELFLLSGSSYEYHLNRLFRLLCLGCLVDSDTIVYFQFLNDKLYSSTKKMAFGKIVVLVNFIIQKLKSKHSVSLVGG